MASRCEIGTFVYKCIVKLREGSLAALPGEPDGGGVREAGHDEDGGRVVHDRVDAGQLLGGLQQAAQQHRPPRHPRPRQPRPGDRLPRPRPHTHLSQDRRDRDDDDDDDNTMTNDHSPEYPPARPSPWRDAASAYPTPSLPPPSVPEYEHTMSQLLQ